MGKIVFRLLYLCFSSNSCTTLTMKVALSYLHPPSPLIAPFYSFKLIVLDTVEKETPR